MYLNAAADGNQAIKIKINILKLYNFFLTYTFPQMFLLKTKQLNTKKLKEPFR
jgi:hypothetical protein